MTGSKTRNVILAVVVLGVGIGVLRAAAPSAASGDGGKAFSSCMRAHDLPDFPDVAVSEDGLINLDIRGERVDALSAKYGAAVRACESLLPSGAALPSGPHAPSAPPGTSSSP
ncbi:hypothetical protein [Microtetraspora niveoalba]|uniref:hypothetical protein n=1 Tax=Microtetraspora niveoalba TaxID=46175 RepID=UPI00083612F1|nr:hypothetical protein [Microtetraspora niveoalba]